MLETEDRTRFTITIFGKIFKAFCIFHVNGYNAMKNGVIYILIWSPQEWTPFDVIPMEQKAFENCIFNNCFLTGNHSYLENIMDFDVLMFGIWQVGLTNLDNDSNITLPSNRSETQKYCMYTMEPRASIKFLNHGMGILI